MNLNQIELLKILLETDFNQSKAAERMHVVQSAASRQLQMLEDELGSPLFQRYGKKLVGLTPLGKQVMEEVQRITLAKRNIETMASTYQRYHRGALRIATTHTQAKYLLPKPIMRFRQKYEGFNIFMVQSAPETLIQSLHNYEADIAICTEKVNEDEDLVINTCYEWHHIAVVPKDHPLASRAEIKTLKDISSYPILTYSQGFTGRSNIERAFKKENRELNIALSAADSDIIKTYVRLGLGVGIIASMAYDAVQDSDLVEIDLGHLIPKSVTKIAYLKQLYLPEYLKDFINELIVESASLHI